MDGKILERLSVWFKENNTFAEVAHNDSLLSVDQCYAMIQLATGLGHTEPAFGQLNGSTAKSKSVETKREK